MILILLFLIIGHLFSMSDLKFAIVKQVTYQDMYCAPTNTNVPDLIFSSLKRPYFVGLFNKFSVDFHIVDTEEDEECQVWKEKVFYSKHTPLSYYESLRDKIDSNWGKVSGQKVPQGVYMKKCVEIDWSKYDIVISADISIPERITKKYPSVLWTYFHGEGGPSIAKSFKNPIKGYDCYLTADFFLNRNLEKHVVECPVYLVYHNCFAELFPGIKFKKSGGLLETHTSLALNNREESVLNEIIKIKRSNDRLSSRDMIKSYLEAKYFIQWIDKSRGVRSFTKGNSIMQAISSGALVLCGENNAYNLDLLSEKTIVKSFNDLVEKLKFLEDNPLEYEKELKKQREKLDYLCFNRPIDHLYSQLLEKRLKNEKK